MRSFLRSALLAGFIVAAVIACVPALAPSIVSHPEDVTTSVGQTASFEVEAYGFPEEAPLAYRWFRSDDAGDTFYELSGATSDTLLVDTVTLADDDARFRVRVLNEHGNTLSNPARLTVVADCPMPPLPLLDRTAPTAATLPTAAYGANLLANPGFETTAWVGPPPAAFGYWRFDESASVAAQQGIAPRSGTGMLQFVSTGSDVTVFGGGSAAEQIQVIDVTGLQTAIDAEEVRLHASAWFARVAGCATTDDAFGIYVAAFDGDIGTYVERWNNGIDAATDQGVDRDVADMTGVDGWLMHRRASIRHHDPDDRLETAEGAVFDWREVTLEADVPAGTTLLMFGVYALENVVNDTVFPELHGHYADDIAVVLEPRDP